jgi:hypothetical protein
MLLPRQYGQAQPDGTRTKPEVSAISGRPVLKGDPIITIGDYTVSVKADEWRRLTEAQRALLKAEWAELLPKPQAGEPEKTAYADLSFDDLKALATERGLDISGRRSSQSIVQALEADDIQKQLTAPPAGVVSTEG